MSFFIAFVYCHSLWTGCKKSTFYKLGVAFKDAHRQILKLPWPCIVSEICNFGIYNLETIIW